MIALICATLVASADPSAANLAPGFAEVQQSAPSEQPNQLQESSTAESAGAHAGWSHQQLVAERDRLDAARPSLGPPIAILSVGGALVIAAGYYALSYASLAWALTSFLGGGPGQGSFGLDQDSARGCSIVALVGAVGVAVGLAYLAPTVAKRRAIGTELDRVSEELDEREQRRVRAPVAAPVSPQLSRPPLLSVSGTIARF